jgi:hypothetical protein
MWCCVTEVVVSYVLKTTVPKSWTLKSQKPLPQQQWITSHMKQILYNTDVRISTHKPQMHISENSNLNQHVDTSNKLFIHWSLNILISAPRYYALKCTEFKFPHSILSANFAAKIKNQKEDTRKKNTQPFKVTFLLSQYIAASSTAVTEQVFRKYYSENYSGHHKSIQTVLR